jgi:hypothetical protein
MLVFAASDKGGTGRSVTSCNVLYRSALQGSDVCYLDFDFGSPTAGAIFDLTAVARGTTAGRGLHSYLQGNCAEPHRLDVWAETDRASLRHRPLGAGRIVLLPGETSGSEFSPNDEVVERCCRLLLRLDEEFDMVLVDLSAGRSHALEMVLKATAMPDLRAIKSRWLVFHRWTRQHVIAASGLIYGDPGIYETGLAAGHPAGSLQRSLRLVHTAVVDPDADELYGLQPEQVAWLRSVDTELRRQAGDLRVGRSLLLGAVPLDPVLQWREQLITDADVLMRAIANSATRDAFELLAKQIVDDDAWETL